MNKYSTDHAKDKIKCKITATINKGDPDSFKMEINFNEGHRKQQIQIHFVTSQQDFEFML